MGHIPQKREREEEDQRMIELRQSDLQTYMNCRRQFYLEVVLNLAHPRTEQFPRKHNTAATGTLIHEVLKAYYTGQLSEEPSREEVQLIVVAKADELMGRDEEAWDVELEASRMKDWNDAVVTASIVAHNYIPWVEREGLDLRYTVRSVEERLRAEVPGTRIVLSGQPDLLYYDEILGEVGIVDHKSVATLDAPRPGNFQLLTYGVLYWWTTGEVPEWAAHNQLKRNKQTDRAKPPFYARQPVHLDQQILELHAEMLIGLCQEIELFMDSINENNHRTKAFPNMTGECDWKCGVKELCDRFHDGDDVWQDMSTHLYIQRPALEN